MIRSASALLLLILMPAAALAQAQPEDSAAIAACLQSAKDNPERCIGAVYRPCTDTREGGTTAGMGVCAARETAVWNAQLEEHLVMLLNGPLGNITAQPHNRPRGNRHRSPVKGAVILRDMHQTWLFWRAKKCDTLAMQAEGGSLSRVLYGTCINEETARQALWLNRLVADTTR